MTQQHDFTPSGRFTLRRSGVPSWAGRNLPADHAAGVDPSSAYDARLLENAAIDAGLLAIAMGDKDQFAILFNVYAPRAKTYLMRLGLPAPVAENLAVETMVEVWNTAAAFDPGNDACHAWMFQRLSRVVARNRTLFPQAPARTPQVGKPPR